MSDKHKEKEQTGGFLNNSGITQINAGLFLFYLALLGNYTGDLIPPDLSKLINKSRMCQHVIAFIILLFTINLYSTKKLYKVFLYTFVLWLWFLLTSNNIYI